jgi:hypothetical protein
MRSSSFKVSSFIAIGVLLISSVSFANDQVGHLCLAAAPTPSEGPTSLGNPTGGLPGASYSIRINGGDALALSRSTGTWSGPLSLSDRHTVAISQDGKQIESFHFNFDPSKTSELCLFMKSLYRTWILWPLQKTGSWCSCGPTPPGRPAV